MPKFKLEEGVKFCLKVMINREKSKVLFAEADSNFAEALLSFLALPLGEIANKLEKHDKSHSVGSLTTLYKGVKNLNDECFFTEGGKQMLLNPRSSFFDEPIKCFRCTERNCKRKRTPNASIYYGTRKCDCGSLLSKPMGDMEINTQSPYDEIFADEQLSFLVTDDLLMAPIERGCIIQTLINLGITVTQGAELMNVTLGYNKMMKLLKGSLLSKTPLTDVILLKKSKRECAEGDILHEMVLSPSSNSKKVVVKAVVHQYAETLVCVLAEEDFIDFLLSFLAIPLSGVEYLSGGKTCIKNVDNLYKSIANFIDDKYLTTPDTKNWLLKPHLPPNYLSKNHIFTLSQEPTPSIYYFESRQDSHNETVEKGSWMCFKDPKGDEGCYIKPQEFVVFDDLTVIPSVLYVTPSLAAFPDYKVLELHIGLKEGLDILKASLVSSSALTLGLLNPFLKNQQKQGI